MVCSRGSLNLSIFFHVTPRIYFPTFSRPLEQRRSARGTRLVIHTFTVKERGPNRGRHGHSTARFTLQTPAVPTTLPSNSTHRMHANRVAPRQAIQYPCYLGPIEPASYKFRGCITPTSSPAAGPRAPNQQRLRQLLRSAIPHHPKERPRNRFLVLRPLHLARIGRASLHKRERIKFPLRTKSLKSSSMILFPR